MGLFNFLTQDIAIDLGTANTLVYVKGRGIVLNVRTKPCGRSMCGRVERVKDRRGYDTPSTMVGQKVLWDLKPQPDGSFLGKMVDSQGNWLSETRIEARSGKLHLRACGDDGCQDLVWKRLR